MGGAPTQLRSEAEPCGKDAMSSPGREAQASLQTAGGRSSASDLSWLPASKSIPHKEELQVPAVSTVARFACGQACSMEWQCVEVSGSCCWRHCAVHTVDAACVNTRASVSTAVIAGKVRRRSELTTFPAYASCFGISPDHGAFGNHGPRSHGHLIKQHALGQRTGRQQHANHMFAADGGGNRTKCRAH
jgi:hypothetical protein